MKNVLIGLKKEKKMNLSDKIKKQILNHIKYRESFVEVKSAFHLMYKKNGTGQSYTFCGMTSMINTHLDKTCKKINDIILKEEKNDSRRKRNK